MSDIRPFLAFEAHATRAFADALSPVPVAPATSPWSPKSEVAAPSVDVATLRTDAIEAGRAQGMAETAELRRQLRELIAAIDARQRARAAMIGELVAEAACAVVGAWSETTDPRTMFEPIIRAWGDSGSTTVRVHPEDVGALGEVAMSIVPDATMQRGDIVLRSGAAELEHRWADRISELRHAIAAVIEERK